MSAAWDLNPCRLSKEQLLVADFGVVPGSAAARIGTTWLRTINIRSEGDKTHKEFFLPISGPLYEHIDRAIAWADSLHFKATDQLFNVNRFSSHYRRETMDIHQIEARYRKLMALVGTRMTPHRFRHTLASGLMRQADRNIHVAKALLNHSSIATTMEYIETDPHQMRHVSKNVPIRYRRA
ncbi:site-specific integrase [Pseudomonas sp. 102515]|uniref:site-specific integrase n=1 Tax=Pseudomonas sp. 102515 TaxID=3071568 RepID=UPI002802EFAB|nr:site-specific integrase [Pseudomonas sp. 102515]MDQ7912352.1 site-specific integrase [Pseudomonas sp. 102515]